MLYKTSSLSLFSSKRRKKLEVRSKRMNLWFSVILVMSVVTVRVDGQLDSNGFINIDCGRATNSSFYDSNTGLTLVSDDQFTDRGDNHRIDSKYVTQTLPEELQTVRSFPTGTRNCYTLRSLTIESKYLVRGLFKYGNYDNSNKPPIFDVHLGVNYWDTVVATADSSTFLTEIITTATSDYLQVCLINKGLGIPFISVLHLNQLLPDSYHGANSTQSLVYYNRVNLGASSLLRYPDDPYDRFWVPYLGDTLTNIATTSKIDPDKEFLTPSAVLQTAGTTLSTTEPLNISWTSDNTSTDFFVILHFSEIQNIASTDIREFDILANEFLVFNESYVPSKLYSGWASYTHTQNSKYTISLQATSRSTLPPLLNAYELYVITPTTGIPTATGDATAMNTIKANYKVNKDWSGDPCVPIKFSWSGVTCSLDSSNSPRITALDLSSSGLTGAIISDFGSLSALKSLDLSHNDLSGDLPEFLDKLTTLTYLDVRGNNKISTTLPPGLQSKMNNGNLIFEWDHHKKKKWPILLVIIPIVVVVLVIAAAIIIVVCLRRCRNENPNNPQPPVEPVTIPPELNDHSNTPEVNSTPQGNCPGPSHAYAPNPNEREVIRDQIRRFRYNELVGITNDFQNNIGTGGFGSVYVGSLDDDTPVAVKRHSGGTSQGVAQFLAEAQNLPRVHHRNLISLLGYCMDGDCMALVYEYMQEGTLQNKLKDNARPLSWKQRLKIAYESALGLDYLHQSCNPPLIHRDVKTSNILLNGNFEARIADFGLSRVLDNAESTYVSTIVAGTPGYLDPEYCSLNQLSIKSDVYSFGVVLLEIITGRSPIIPNTEGGHLKQWVNQMLSRGDIESIVDLRLNGYYDINSIWKATELALECTDNHSVRRPAMSEVVKKLKEYLDLEIKTEGTRGNSTTYNRSHNYPRDRNFVHDVSQNSVFEMDYMAGPGPIPR